VVDDAINLISDRLERARDRHATIPPGTAARLDAADDVRRLEATLDELARLNQTVATLVETELAIEL
jgi:hypothetical protein